MVLGKVAVFIAFLILISASVPVYASHVTEREPTEDEKRLFENVLQRLEKHYQEDELDDVKKSFSQPVKISFPCNSMKSSAVNSVAVDVSTTLVRFDRNIAEQHNDELGAAYVWKCSIVKESTLTIECTNMLMLNPDFMLREEKEADEMRVIAMAENEMVLYHELLHGQLMIDAMNDSRDVLGWRASACTFFADNDNSMDYSSSDAEHKVIADKELQYLSSVMEREGGVVMVKKVSKDVGPGRFTQVIARFDELGSIAKSNFFVFARANNLDNTEIKVSESDQTVSLVGELQDRNNDASVKLFVLPSLSTAKVEIELSVDDFTKTVRSAFVFTVKVRNADTNSVEGDLELFVDGLTVDSKRLTVHAGRTATAKFTWTSSDGKPAVHYMKVNGFNTASNEITVTVFDRFESAKTNGEAAIEEQTVVDSTGKEMIVAKPERISAFVALDDPAYMVKLIAPDGTVVIGEDGLVGKPGNRASIVDLDGQRVIVRYKQLNERILFLAVKAGAGNTLEGMWLIKTFDAMGLEGVGKIRYSTSYAEVPSST